MKANREILRVYERRLRLEQIGGRSFFFLFLVGRILKETIELIRWGFFSSEKWDVIFKKHVQ